MRFVQKLSYCCAKQLALLLKEDHYKKAIYYFGFSILFILVIKGLILISISLPLGILQPTLIIVAVFGSLRMFAGGFHFDTLGRCLYVSLAMILSSALVSKYTFHFFSAISTILLSATVFFISSYFVLKYAPKDTAKKRITEPEAIKKFKRLSVLYLCVWFVLCCILTILNQGLSVLALNLGVILEIFSITPTGNSFFNKLMKI